jgi:uncharacterized membrane protein
VSELVVLIFDQEGEAEEVRHALRRQEQAGTLDLEDTAVVARDAEGKVRVNNQVSDTTKWTTVGGGILGLMVGVFVFPLMGIAAGVAGGALLGRVLDRGIDGAFVKEVSAALTPGSSALFIMINSSRPDAAISTLRGFKGKVYHTTLEGDAEESLRRALHEQR